MKTKKVLFTATVVKKHIVEFHLPYLKWFKDHGYETYVAANNDYNTVEECIIPYCDHFIEIPFTRNPISISNIIAYLMLKKLIIDQHFDIIHCNTPVGGVLTRLAARKARSFGTKVVYTAHGFHFYRGSSIIAWALYYPIEKICSKYTDAIITINREDYQIAKSKFSAKNTYLVHGVGVNFNSRPNYVDDSIYQSIKCNSDDFIICTTAELISRKNQKLIIEAMKNPILLNNKHIKYVLIGDGKNKSQYLQLINSNHLANRIILLGYRTDVYNILQHSSVFAFPSLREGLPVSLMEAMYCQLPCLVCDVRGCRDLIDNEKGGYICSNNADDFANKINYLFRNSEVSKKYGEYNLEKVKPYMIDQVLKEYANIYCSLLKE